MHHRTVTDHHTERNFKIPSLNCDSALGHRLRIRGINYREIYHYEAVNHPLRLKSSLTIIEHYYIDNKKKIEDC